MGSGRPLPVVQATVVLVPVPSAVMWVVAVTFVVVVIMVAPTVVATL